MSEFLINYLIGCAISSDSNLNNEQRQNNINLLEMMLNNQSKLNLNEDQEKCVKDGIELLKKEMEDEKNV